MTQLSKLQIETEIALMVADPVYALKMLFPDWFPDKMPWLHRGILAILTKNTGFLDKYSEVDKIIKNFVWREDPWDSQSPARPLFSRNEQGGIDLRLTPYTLIMLPRGFSKTTLLNGVNIYSTLLQLRKFIVYLSETGPMADIQLKNVQNQLTGNDLIKSLFGNLKPIQGSGLTWASDFFQTTTGVSFLARGRGSQIRGQNVNAQRPDLILLDDVEDLEAVSTEAQLEKTRRWFYRDVEPALAVRDPSAAVVVLGTLLHSDALLVTLSRDPRFNTIIFGAEDDEGKALWPEQLSLEQLNLKKQAAAKAMQLGGFYMEYYNQVRSVEDAKFNEKMFRWEPVPEAEEADCITAMAIDPAISENANADFAVIAVVSMHLKKGLIYVRDMWMKRGASPREQVDQYFALSKKWKVKHHGVEAIAFQAALVHMLREDMFRQKHYFEITEIKHRNKKEDRILGILQPRYANKYIIHTRRFADLESQLLDFPNGKNDAPDALSMAITLLDPYAAAAADPDLDLGDDEYEPLDKVFKGNWRRH